MHMARTVHLVTGGDALKFKERRKYPRNFVNCGDWEVID